MINKSKVLIISIISLIITVFIILQFIYNPYGEKYVFKKSEPLNLYEQKKKLTNQMHRNEKYYKNINHHINKLDIQNESELHGLPSNLGSGVEDIVAQFFSAALIADANLFISYIDPNEILKDEEINLDPKILHKDMNFITKNKTLQEVYLIEKAPLSDNKIKVKILLTYKNGEEIDLIIKLAKMTHLHTDSEEFYVLSTSISDIKKQINS